MTIRLSEMDGLKSLDLFSGIGGFALAAERAGIETAAFCEIDKFPQSVLKYRYPDIPVIDDVRKLTKETFKSATGLDYVDIVCGGSPCQTCRLRESARACAGAKADFFMNMQELSTNLSRNSPSGKTCPGHCHRTADGTSNPCCARLRDTPESRSKMGERGILQGTERILQRRLSDSRFGFFGVPQRRRRVFLVASLGDDSCAEILFEQARLRGNFASGENEEQDIAAVAERGFGEHTENAVDYTLILTETSATIQSESPTLTASMSKIYNRQTPILFENHAQDSRYRQRDDSPTITSRCGTGGNNLPLVVKQHNHGEVSVSEISPTLNSQSGAGRIPMAVSIAENIINRKDCNGGNGIGALEENCYTLNATGVHAVASESKIRRLTPLECERLQGFPDNWTLVPDARDTNRYKACGNAITVNVAE